MEQQSRMVCSLRLIIQGKHLLYLQMLVNFDAGPSWAGLMPISGAANETRKLFFW